MNNWAKAFRQALELPENKERVLNFRKARTLAEKNKNKYKINIENFAFIFITISVIGRFNYLYDNSFDLREIGEFMPFESKSKTENGVFNFNFPCIPNGVLIKILNKYNRCGCNRVCVLSS